MMQTLRRLRPYLPYFALIIGIFSLTMSSFFVRWAKSPGPVSQFYRMSLAALVLLPFYLHQTPEVRKIHRPWLILPIIGGVLTAFDHITWSVAIGFTRIANATLLNYIAPLWVALAAFFIGRERFARLFWLGLALTLCGAGIVLGNDYMRHPTLSGGDGLALISSFFYAGYFLVTQRSRQHINTLSHVFWVVVIASATILLVDLMFGLKMWGYDQNTYLAFIGAAIISQVGGYFSIGYALGKLPASVVSPTLVVQPVLTALMAIPIAGEGLTISQWIGGGAVILGIYIVNKNQPEKNVLESEV